jgi:hypothetical protein
MRIPALITLVVLSCSCAAPEPSVGRAVRGSAPNLTGKADAADQADRSCQIVLRSVDRRAGDNGYETQCTAGGCNWIWDAEVEISKEIKGATVHLLYRRVGDPTWWQVDAIPAAHSQPGFVRHKLSIHEHLFGPSATEAELAAARIEVMPYLELPDGARLYDHNRRPGDFDNYVLELENGFGLGDGGACASVFGRISFFDSWGEHLTGTLRQGGYLVLNYDLDRLPTCRGTHNGHPAWDIVAHVKFSPGGQLVTGSVRAFDSPQGLPTGPGRSEALEVKIPADATEAEIWFHNYTGAGSSCQAWDSNYGANYVYEIWPPASDPRCKDIERWTSIHSDLPYASPPHCLAYTVDQQHDANHCELYLSGFGHGYVGHYGIPQHWLEAYITVGLQQGKLLGAGMLTQYRDPKHNTTGQRFTYGQQVAPDTWQTGFIFQRTTYMSQSYHYDVEQIAFFIDVQRPSGDVVRLWQSRQGANYGWYDAFTLPTSTKYIAYGNIKYAGNGSAIFDARQACTN